MLGSAIGQRIGSLGKQAAKSGMLRVADQVRGLSGVPLASGKLRASEILAGVCPSIDPADYRHSFTVQEVLPDDGIALPHRRIDTFHLVLDTRDPGYSFRNNVVVAPGNSVIYEDSIPFNEMSVRSRLLERPRRVTGAVGYLSNTNVDNYHHWFGYTLPFIGTYRERLGVDPDFYYVGRPLKPFHLESLARAGIAADRILSDAVTGDRLIADIPDRRRRAGAVDTAMLGFSRTLFYEPSAAPTRRLFVGRRDWTHRRLANEDQCLELAARHGFESVSMDGRTVADQARLFAEADCIIAPHGAALTNLLFVSPQAKVLEMLPAEPSASVPIDAPVLTVFREVAAFVGCRYDWIFGTPLPTQRHLPQSHADFSVSFDEFRAKLVAMVAPD